MGGLKLLRAANPKLFSDPECDKYPTSYDELSVFLKREQVYSGAELATELDYLDSVLYGDRERGIDLDRKLRVEYAMFKATTMQNERAGPGPSLDELVVLNEQIQNAHKQRTSEITQKQNAFYAALMALLQSVSLDQAALQSILTAAEGGRDCDDLEKSSSGMSRSIQPSPLDEVTSYLISGALQHGVELKPSTLEPESPRDDITFFKECIDSLLRNVGLTQPPAENQDRDNDRKDETGDSDVAVALKDLQLAHSFLTKKFEGDRNEYLHSIDKLTRTNKELSHELLTYHSELTTVKENCDALTKEREELKSQLEYHTSLNTPTLVASSPVSNASASSAASGSKSYSIGVMRSEFKKVLTDTQNRYEKELQEERELRKQLEQELSSFRTRRSGHNL
ncbi:Pea2p [Lachancea thermotolerans CBS 6340]|uniref:KLTH0H07480p n=1 Tax=Lachancea thermotolerans (strain ATCC 56472 / CBS 6340 / NRRL Y-8284) TaxID=559295 RepID=C5E2T1_LACTC|nr:KLTH0H07480p [Lachancea thermotolerans CBS 6340]CAR30342.1 KLTH0H07480p [Lachancea thermotolerans CBS 6340]